ncbi:MAG: MFS transporter [Deltaproteobacteria bacterium]|nr:MFS transporter [Deltaproteobacteria bacterium]
MTGILAGRKAAGLIALMCIAEVFGMLGFATFPALMPVFFGEWGLSNTDAGWINAIFFAGYILSVAVLVSLTDWFDPRRIYLVCVTISILALMGFSLFATGFWSAMLLRSLAGVGLAGTYMPGLKALSDLIDGPAQSRAVSFYTASFGIGTSLSFFMAGQINAWLGWRWAFGLAMAGPALALIMVALWLPARAPVPREVSTHPVQDFLTVLRNGQAMGYTLAYTWHNFELFGFRSWLVAFLVFSQGLQAQGSALLAKPATLAALATLVALPSSVSGNELALKFGRKRTVMVLMSASAVLAWLLGFSAGLSFPLVMGLTLLYGVAVMMDSSAITAGTVSNAPPGLRGTTMAVHSCVGFSGAFLGPLVFGMVLDAAGGGGSILSWGLAFGTLGAVVALGPLSLALMVHTRDEGSAVPIRSGAKA